VLSMGRPELEERKRFELKFWMTFICFQVINSKHSKAFNSISWPWYIYHGFRKGFS
jgi:hypothetical protein